MKLNRLYIFKMSLKLLIVKFFGEFDRDKFITESQYI